MNHLTQVNDFQIITLFILLSKFHLGKGANSVISMLNYYIEKHGLHATNIHLNADNCSGQNKNNAVIQVWLSCSYYMHIDSSLI